MLGALKSDLIKFRHTWILPLCILGAVGVVSLTGVHYAVSYREMVRPGSNDWPGLIQNINFLLIPALILGVALIASLMSGMEHQGNTWKQLLAMPVPRVKMYFSKFIWLAVFLAGATALALVGTGILGFLLGFHGPVPWKAVFQEGFAPYIAAYALMALQLVLSVLVANQSLAISVGIVGVIVSFANMITHLIPNWIPWVYPASAAPYASSAAHYMTLSILVCLLLLCCGIYLFAKHQAK